MMENSSYNSNTVSQELAESLSALVDAEQNDLDLQRVLKNLDADSDEAAHRQAVLRQTWSRYHLAGALMRKEAIPDISIDFSQSISAAIEAEDAPAGAARKNAGKRAQVGVSGWWSGIGKTAVAASVTLGVVFAAQQFTGGSSGEGENSAAALVTAPSDNTANDLIGAGVPPGFELPSLSASTVSGSAFLPQQSAPQQAPFRGTVDISSDKFRAQMDRLMYKHAEQVSDSGALGVIPFARVSDGRVLKDASTKSQAAKKDGSKIAAKSGIDAQNEVVKEAQ